MLTRGHGSLRYSGKSKTLTKKKSFEKIVSKPK